MSTGKNTSKYIEIRYVLIEQHMYICRYAGFSFKCVKGKKNEKVGAFGFI